MAQHSGFGNYKPRGVKPPGPSKSNPDKRAKNSPRNPGKKNKKMKY